MFYDRDRQVNLNKNPHPLPKTNLLQKKQPRSQCIACCLSWWPGNYSSLTGRNFRNQKLVEIAVPQLPLWDNRQSCTIWKHLPNTNAHFCQSRQRKQSWNELSVNHVLSVPRQPAQCWSGGLADTRPAVRSASAKLGNQLQNKFEQAICVYILALCIPGTRHRQPAVGTQRAIRCFVKTHARQQTFAEWHCQKHSGAYY